MKFGYLLLAITEAVSEYKRRDEPVPEMLRRTKVWVERQVELYGEDGDADYYDLTQMFLQMAGWPY